MLVALILLAFVVFSASIFLWVELSITNDRIIWLEERLTKLEKDAVKITFNDPYSPQDEKPVRNPLRKSNPKQFDGVTSDEPFVKTRKKRKPKTVGEWEEEVDLGGHE